MNRKYIAGGSIKERSVIISSGEWTYYTTGIFVTFVIPGLSSELVD